MALSRFPNGGRLGGLSFAFVALVVLSILFYKPAARALQPYWNYFEDQKALRSSDLLLEKYKLRSIAEGECFLVATTEGQVSVGTLGEYKESNNSRSKLSRNVESAIYELVPSIKKEPGADTFSFDYVYLEPVDIGEPFAGYKPGQFDRIAKSVRQYLEEPANWKYQMNFWNCSKQNRGYKFWIQKLSEMVANRDINNK